jgi:selT/selW/selH-like putative selenoprotein
MKGKLEIMYPGYHFQGQNFPLPPLTSFLSQLTGYLQIGLIAFALLGHRIQAVAQHPLYQRFQENRMFVMLGLYFGLNFLQSYLTSTGAFEVYVDDQLVFSKLQVQRLPTLEELDRLLQ